MKLKNNILVISLLISTCAFAIPTDSIFLKMPNHLIPSLSPKQRFELAEYAKAGKKDSVLNQFNKKVFLQKYDTANCAISIKTTETSDIEIRRFIIPKQVKPILAIIHTIQLPVKYSTITFFTENWDPVAFSLKFPSLEQWIDLDELKKSTVSETLVKSILDKKYFSFRFTDTNELEIENNVLSVLNIEDKKTASSFLTKKTITIPIVK